MKVYHAKRGADVVTCSVGDPEAGGRAPLRHRVRHSPTGFEMGYGGSGPADLALSIAWDALGREPHPAAYQGLKRRVVAAHRNGFTVSEESVRAILAEEALRGWTPENRIAYRCGERGELLTDEEVEAWFETNRIER